MEYYLELEIQPNGEIPEYFIWAKLYMQLHLAFVEHKNEQEKVPYGISFPEYQINDQKKAAFLGSKMRIFAHSEQELQQLDLNKWCHRLTDYVHITAPRKVPQKKITGYAHYFRYNPKIRMEDRIAHQAARHHVSLSEARVYFADYPEQAENIPYIHLQSLSRHSSFRLYIGKLTANDAVDELFGTYGLSRNSTVPEF